MANSVEVVRIIKSITSHGWIHIPINSLKKACGAQLGIRQDQINSDP